MSAKTFRERVGEEKYEKLLAYNRAHRKNNPELHREYAKRKRHAKKEQCFSLFGGACEKCGFSDARALQIDHIHGVPEGQRRVPGNPHRGGHKLYMAIVSGRYPKSDFQLLCANCNWIKRFENGENGNYQFKKAV